MFSRSIVRLGEHDLNSKTDCIRTRNGEFCLSSPQDFHPSEVLSHPDFNPTTVDSDIALIRLDGFAEFTSMLKY